MDYVKQLSAETKSEQNMKDRNFTSLHQQSTPLLICNVWDVASAKAAQELGFQAIGTSSAAIAKMLGYADGQYMPFEELLFMVTRISKCCQLPLTVDIEAGFSEQPKVTASYLKALAQVGVVGVNIEDSLVDKTTGSRTLKAAKQFASYLAKVKKLLSEENVEMFFNVRTDTFLLGVEDMLAETKARSALYKSAGADGLFVPCIVENEAIADIAASTDLPVNVMCMPELAGFSTLATLGVKRISMGNFLHEHIQNSLVSQLANIKHNDSFQSVF